jgi:hypothetical protein
MPQLFFTQAQEAQHKMENDDHRSAQHNAKQNPQISQVLMNNLYH